MFYMKHAASKKKIISIAKSKASKSAPKKSAKIFKPVVRKRKRKSVAATAPKIELKKIKAASTVKTKNRKLKPKVSAKKIQSGETNDASRFRSSAPVGGKKG